MCWWFVLSVKYGLRKGAYMLVVGRFHGTVDHNPVLQLGMHIFRICSPHEGKMGYVMHVILHIHILSTGLKYGWLSTGWGWRSVTWVGLTFISTIPQVLFRQIKLTQFGN